MLQGSYVLRLSAWGVSAALIIALLSGLVLFALLTRRLRHLSFAMQAFFRESAAMQTPIVDASSTTGDEVDRLEQHFEAMAQRIREQMDALRRDHAQRRELIANVSHDLRTPLATLHGYLETLLMKGDGLSEQERGHYLEIAVANSQQLAKLVDELFELAKLDAYESPLHTEPFSVGELVQDVLPKYQLMAERKGIALDVQFDPALPFVRGDIGMIQRALDNLIENAIRHTPDGGRIAVTLTPEHDRVKVSVHDNGCGIPAEELPHIFDRFYRLQKSREEGAGHAGLGLAIAKRIVELHGAVIHAESQLDVGTTFSFDLPAFPS